jgi:hypothetical protein
LFFSYGLTIATISFAINQQLHLFYLINKQPQNKIKTYVGCCKWIRGTQLLFLTTGFMLSILSMLVPLKPELAVRHHLLLPPTLFLEVYYCVSCELSVASAIDSIKK